MCCLGSQPTSLDDSPCFQLVARGTSLPLPCARRMPPTLVDRVGEVDRVSPPQRLDVALGREDVDLVGEQVDADVVEELLRVRGVLLGFHQLAEPHERFVDLVLALAGLLFLVEPVRGDPVLGDAVHLGRPDLDLDRLALRSPRRVHDCTLTFGSR